MASPTDNVTNTPPNPEQLTPPNGVTSTYIKAIDDASGDVREQIGNLLYQINGSRQYTAFQDSMYGIDSVRNTMYMPEMEGHGFTFITRPKLNLSPMSIRSDRILSMLNTLDPDTVGYAIRAMLDTKLTNLCNISTKASSFLNEANPFIPILSNRLVSLNGWPDPTIDIETTEGGFFSESITYPKGSDMLARNYDISATFSDVQGSIVYMLMTMWTRWIMLATRGLVTAYMEDIEARRMCFTSSIYRFVMDPSNRYITKWAKATGCFPRSVPSGAYFNYDANASNVDVSMNLSIPFTVSGKIEYMDPIILREFNMLIEKKTGAAWSNKAGTSTLSGGIATFKPALNYDRLMTNFRCLPYIDLSYGSNELQWLYDPNDTTVSSIMSNTFKSVFNVPASTFTTGAGVKPILPDTGTSTGSGLTPWSS